MAHTAHPLLGDDDSPIPPAVAARHAIAKQQRGLGVDDLALAQAGHDAGLVDDRVGRADAAPEVRLEVGDG